MKRTWVVVAALFGLMLAVATLADSPKIGVVVLHGKWGSPDGQTESLATSLKGGNLFVESPELPWSGRRAYDRDMDHFVMQMDAVVKALRDKGAKKIFLVGHSMGANGALYYAGKVKVDGLVVIAPGHFPEGKVMHKQYEEDVKKAERLVRTGKGEEDRFVFMDSNSGNRTRSMRVSAKSFLSYFASDGPMNFAQNCANVKPETPVLWITPNGEQETIKRMGESCYARLPSDPISSHVKVLGDHMGAPDASKTIVREWLQTQW